MYIHINLREKSSNSWGQRYQNPLRSLEGVCLRRGRQLHDLVFNDDIASQPCFVKTERSIESIKLMQNNKKSKSFGDII